MARRRLAAIPAFKIPEPRRRSKDSCPRPFPPLPHLGDDFQLVVAHRLHGGFVRGEGVVDGDLVVCRAKVFTALGGGVELAAATTRCMCRTLSKLDELILAPRLHSSRPRVPSPTFRTRMTEPPSTPHGLFPDTLWSMVVGAGEADGDTALAALERLARAYWQPLHVFLRQRGMGHHEAADAVQGFFAHLIRREVLHGLERRETRFRTFLLTCLNRWQSNQRRDANALRRGGGARALPIHELPAEQLPADMPAEHLYDRFWARALFDHALARLDAEIEARGERREFLQELRRRVCGSLSGRPQWDEVAERFGMSTVAVRKAAHDLRQRFAVLLRHEVRKVVGSDAEVDDELRHLAGLLAE